MQQTQEERPKCDSAILKALFDTLPIVFLKEDARRWVGQTIKSAKENDDE